MTSMVSNVAAAIEVNAHAVGMVLRKEQTRFLARVAMAAIHEYWRVESCFESARYDIDAALSEDKP